MNRLANDGFSNAVGPRMKTMAFKKGELAHVISHFMEGSEGVLKAETLCKARLVVRRGEKWEWGVGSCGNWYTNRCKACESVWDKQLSAQRPYGPRPIFEKVIHE